MRKNVFITLLIVVINLFCGCAASLQKSVSKLPFDEQAEFKKNWGIAEKILRYDRFSSIASDSLLRKNIENKIDGYVCVLNDSNPKVVFGKYSEESFLIVYEVIFKRGGVFCKYYPEGVISDESLNKMAFSIKIALEKNVNIINSYDIKYNSYSIINDSIISVYFIPGSKENQLVLSGGIKTCIQPTDLSVISNQILFEKLNIFNITQKPDILYRISNKGNIPNEVDIAQFLIYRHLASVQEIATPKYRFLFEYNPNNGKINLSINPGFFTYYRIFWRW